MGQPHSSFNTNAGKPSLCQSPLSDPEGSRVCSVVASIIVMAHYSATTQFRLILDGVPASGTDVTYSQGNSLSVWRSDVRRPFQTVMLHLAKSVAS